MKFLTMVVTHNEAEAGPPPPALMHAIMELGMATGKSLLETGGMKVVARVGVEDAGIVVDGPYAEAKEAVGGFAIYELEGTGGVIENTQKFLELHRKHWPAWRGEVIIREMIHFGPQ